MTGIPNQSTTPNPAKIVVATTVALSFISFWRGASIVLSDLASTMFYVGGIAERAIGESAPWFILAVLLFGFAIRSIYLESCSMFVRGGVYVVVRDSLGPTMAKISVSALVVDYVLTGPISSVSAGQYLGHLLNELSDLLHAGVHVQPNYFAAFFGVSVTVYFWWQNIKGIHESSSKALRIMQITTLMAVTLLAWCLLTLLLEPSKWRLPEAPTVANIQPHFNDSSAGWLLDTFWLTIWPAVLVIGFGHTLLAMSGFETLAQVYREIAYPKMKNLKITANIVCTYALLATGAVSFFAVMLIPDAVRPQYFDNLIGGLAMHLAGPHLLKLVFHAFVVVVGALILSGAVNTAIIGANGILNRVAEDGVLTEWFRKPHPRFGTTFRLINLITGLQLATIILSRGDMYLLGEAYAFGVVWSFSMKGLGVLGLRLKRHDQEYKFPFNLRVAGREIPVGLALATGALFLVAVANLFTKRIATVAGISFTIVMTAVFLISERINARRRQAVLRGEGTLEEFNLDHQEKADSHSIHARSGCILIAVRDFNHMEHFRRVLEKTNLRRHDIVVMTVRPITQGAGEFDLSREQLFSSYERDLFTRVVHLSEKEGKPVELLVVPSTDPFLALVQTAANLKASRLVTGISRAMAPEELARRIGLAWEKLPEPRHPFSLEIVAPGMEPAYVNLGPHPPRLWPEDVSRLHEIWLDLTGFAGLGSKLHHRDVVRVALQRLEQDLAGASRETVLHELQREIGKN